MTGRSSYPWKSMTPYKPKKKKLTNTVFAQLKKRVIKANPDRFCDMEWDCTGNDHSSDCWCVTGAYALAKKLGYK